MSDTRSNLPAGPAGEGADPAKELPRTQGEPDAIALERAELAALARKPFWVRWPGYARKTGPGWLQSAMTLGGGSAASSLAIGAVFGYKLLWVQPIAMLLGVIMLSAMSYQTLATGARPFGAMKKYVSPALAWAWALATLLATVIWHFPQYAIGAGVTADMVEAVTGWAPAKGAGHVAMMLAIGVVILVVSTVITWNYASGWKGIRLYERALKAMVWVIIASFAVVIVRSTIQGKVAWGEVLKGFLPLYLPLDEHGIMTVLGAFGASVGINMTFMFPYTILARGWTKEYTGLARFDLVTGMFIPFTLATGLMIVAAGCTIYGTVPAGASVKPVEAARMIAAAGVGRFIGRLIFGLGILGMVLSSITTHMLVAGFAAAEIFGFEQKGWKYKLAALIPAPGMLGVILWQYFHMYIAVWTSAICGLMLPIAYVGFFALHNSRRYLGADKPTGGRAWAWNLAMLVSIAAVLVYIAYFLYAKFLSGKT